MRTVAATVGFLLLASTAQAQPEIELWRALERRPSFLSDMAAAAQAMTALSRVLRGAQGDGPLEHYRILSGALGLSLLPVGVLVGYRRWEVIQALHRRCPGALDAACEAELARLGRTSAQRSRVVRLFQGSVRLTQGTLLAPFALTARRQVPTNFGDVLSLVVAVVEIFQGLWLLSHPSEIEEAWAAYEESRLLGASW